MFLTAIPSRLSATDKRRCTASSLKEGSCPPLLDIAGKGGFNMASAQTLRLSAHFARGECNFLRFLGQSLEGGGV